MNPHRPAGQRQQGAALAVALILLVVLTLLGVAAVRSTQTELRLAQNAESRTSAQQASESLIGAILSDIGNTPVNEDPGFRSCYLPAAAVPAARFTCSSANATQFISVTAANSSTAIVEHGYAEVIRVLPLFVSVNVMREAQTSGRQYDFARYSVTAGYDRSAESMSVAEVTESRLVLHSKVAGVNYE